MYIYSIRRVAGDELRAEETDEDKSIGARFGMAGVSKNKVAARRSTSSRVGEDFQLDKIAKAPAGQSDRYAALRAVRARRNNIGIHNFTLGYL